MTTVEQLMEAFKKDIEEMTQKSQDLRNQSDEAKILSYKYDGAIQYAQIKLQDLGRVEESEAAE